MYIFVLPENLLSILESGQSKDKGLYIQCLHFLLVVCSEEGKLKTKRAADNSSVTMTTLLDLPLQSGILFFYFLKHVSPEEQAKYGVDGYEQSGG